MSLECDGGITDRKQGVKAPLDQTAWHEVSSENLLAGDNARMRKRATEKSRPQSRKTLSKTQTEKVGMREVPRLAGLPLSGTALKPNSMT